MSRTKSDIQAVENIIKEFLQDLPNKYEELVSIPDLLGVQSLAASEVMFTSYSGNFTISAAWIARNIRRDLKEYLE